jgi:hypothetical protein
MAANSWHERLRPLAAILLLAGTVCLLMAGMIVIGRWSMPTWVAAILLAFGIGLMAPYVGGLRRERR